MAHISNSGSYSDTLKYMRYHQPRTDRGKDCYLERSFPRMPDPSLEGLWSPKTALNCATTLISRYDMGFAGFPLTLPRDNPLWDR